MKTGVIGLGQMGAGIARNLDRAGLLAAAWDLAPAMRDNAGLSADVAMLPPPDMLACVDAVLFVVPSSVEIAACLDGPPDLPANDLPAMDLPAMDLLAIERPGQVLIDLTTSHPDATVRLARRAAEAGRAYLDGGMSGGAKGADTGRLTLMMGGDADALARVRPALDAIAAQVFHLGGAGAGHTMKLVHNLVCHSNFLVLAEACRLAERAGLALTEVIAVINAGNARSYISEARFPNHILSGAFDGRSRVANLAKDLGMAADLAASLSQPAPYATLTAALLNEAMAAGQAEADFTRLYPAYNEIAAKLQT